MEDGSLSCTLPSDKRNIPVDYKRERDEFVSTGSGDERGRERGFFLVSYLCMRVVMNKYTLVSLSLSLFLGTLSLLFRFMRSKPTGRVPSRRNGI